jgi:hypothetical protein
LSNPSVLMFKSHVIVLVPKKNLMLLLVWLKVWVSFYFCWHCLHFGSASVCDFGLFHYQRYICELSSRIETWT